MFHRCTLECTCCGKAIASLKVHGFTIPRARLRRMAREDGAVTDLGGRWYCGPRCRTAFRLKHDTSHKETPDVR